MNPFSFRQRSHSAAQLCLASAVLGIVSLAPLFTDAAPSAELASSSERALAGQIDCIAPDGRMIAVVSDRTSASQSPAFSTTDNTISCDLPEGDTIFIIPVPKAAALDRFTFVNLNAAASGEFNIAIAASRLKADSPGWVSVDGIVPFSHKRLFNLSLLGTGAKYMRLSFHVEKTSRLTRAGSDLGGSDRSRIAMQPAPPAAGPADD